MISRVAEHCFWMSRYLERIENTARVLDVNRTLLLDFEVPLEQQWKPLLIISGIEDYPGAPDAPTIDLGGSATTKEFGDAVVGFLEADGARAA